MKTKPFLAVFVGVLTASIGFGQNAPTNWVVEKSTSPIDDSPIVNMTLQSVESESTRNGFIRIRWVEKKLEVYASCGGYVGSDSPKVTLRWDAEPAKDEQWSPSTIGEAVFAPDPGEFIERALKASRLVLRVHEFRSPATSMFDLTGLKEALDQLPELKKAVTADVEKSAALRAQEVERRKKSEADLAELQRRAAAAKAERIAREKKFDAELAAIYARYGLRPKASPPIPIKRAQAVRPLPKPSP